VSRKLSRLFVRQGFTPLFDVAVQIQNPEEPLGTLVFTVMEPQDEGSAVRWSLVSIPEQSMSPDSIKDRKVPKQQIVKTAPSATPLSDNANTAFDRIEIPQDAIQQISALLIPGSSLIISDYGISSETGPYTDFHRANALRRGSNISPQGRNLRGTGVKRPRRLVVLVASQLSPRQCFCLIPN